MKPHTYSSYIFSLQNDWLPLPCQSITPFESVVYHSRTPTGSTPQLRSTLDRLLQQYPHNHQLSGAYTPYNGTGPANVVLSLSPNAYLSTAIEPFPLLGLWALCSSSTCSPTTNHLYLQHLQVGQYKMIGTILWRHVWYTKAKGSTQGAFFNPYIFEIFLQRCMFTFFDSVITRFTQMRTKR